MLPTGALLGGCDWIEVFVWMQVRLWEVGGRVLGCIILICLRARIACCVDLVCYFGLPFGIIGLIALWLFVCFVVLPNCLLVFCKLC